MRLALLSALSAVVAVTGCLGPDPEAVAICDEFLTRIADHMTECGFDGDALIVEVEDSGLNCDNAVQVEGDPIACAADFEAIECADLSEASVNETIGECDGEIFVLEEEEE
jgi:hypothetical protein